MSETTSSEPPHQTPHLAPNSTVQVIGLIVSILICFTVGGLGSAATTPSLGEWYAELAKPTWNPPNWIFGPVWSTLFLMMSISAWLVWRNAGFAKGKGALIAFAIQLVLNVGWSLLFFAMQRPDLAFIEIAILWIAIAATIGLFFRHSKLAACLLVPYLLWVSFATFLNYTIWSLNT